MNALQLQGVAHCLPFPLMTAHREQLGQPLPVAAAANKSFLAAMEAGFGDSDFAAVNEAVARKK